eukprot:PhM_4_TR2483/c0_g1_i3/m.33869
MGTASSQLRRKDPAGSRLKPMPSVDVLLESMNDRNSNNYNNNQQTAVCTINDCCEELIQSYICSTAPAIRSKGNQHHHYQQHLGIERVHSVLVPTSSRKRTSCVQIVDPTTTTQEEEEEELEVDPSTTTTTKTISFKRSASCDCAPAPPSLVTHRKSGPLTHLEPVDSVLVPDDGSVSSGRSPLSTPLLFKAGSSRLSQQNQQQQQQTIHCNVHKMWCDFLELVLTSTSNDMSLFDVCKCLESVSRCLSEGGDISQLNNNNNNNHNGIVSRTMSTVSFASSTPSGGRETSNNNNNNNVNTRCGLHFAQNVLEIVRHEVSSLVLENHDIVFGGGCKIQQPQQQQQQSFVRIDRRLTEHIGVGYLSKASGLFYFLWNPEVSNLHEDVHKREYYGALHLVNLMLLVKKSCGSLNFTVPFTSYTTFGGFNITIMSSAVIAPSSSPSKFASTTTTTLEKEITTTFASYLLGVNKKEISSSDVTNLPIKFMRQQNQHPHNHKSLLTAFGAGRFIPYLSGVSLTTKQKVQYFPLPPEGLLRGFRGGAPQQHESSRSVASLMTPSKWIERVLFEDVLAAAGASSSSPTFPSVMSRCAELGATGDICLGLLLLKLVHTHTIPPPALLSGLQVEIISRCVAIHIQSEWRKIFISVMKREQQQQQQMERSPSQVMVNRAASILKQPSGTSFINSAPNSRFATSLVQACTRSADAILRRVMGPKDADFITKTLLPIAQSHFALPFSLNDSKNENDDTNNNNIIFWDTDLTPETMSAIFTRTCAMCGIVVSKGMVSNIRAVSTICPFPLSYPFKFASVYSTPEQVKELTTKLCDVRRALCILSLAANHPPKVLKLIPQSAWIISDNSSTIRDEVGLSGLFASSSFLTLCFARLLALLDANDRRPSPFALYSAEINDLCSELLGYPMRGLTLRGTKAHMCLRSIVLFLQSSSSESSSSAFCCSFSDVLSEIATAEKQLSARATSSREAQDNLFDKIFFLVLLATLCLQQRRRSTSSFPLKYATEALEVATTDIARNEFVSDAETFPHISRLYIFLVKKLRELKQEHSAKLVITLQRAARRFLKIIRRKKFGPNDGALDDDVLKPLRQQQRAQRLMTIFREHMSRCAIQVIVVLRSEYQLTAELFMCEVCEAEEMFRQNLEFEEEYVERNNISLRLLQEQEACKRHLSVHVSEFLSWYDLVLSGLYSEEHHVVNSLRFCILQEQEIAHRVDGVEMEECIARDTLRRSNVADVVPLLLHDVEADESKTRSELFMCELCEAEQLFREVVEFQEEPIERCFLLQEQEACQRHLSVHVSEFVSWHDLALSGMYSEEPIESFGTFFSILQEQEIAHRVDGIEMEERIARDTLRRSNVADVVPLLLHDVEADESKSRSDLSLCELCEAEQLFREVVEYQEEPIERCFLLQEQEACQRHLFVHVSEFVSWHDLALSGMYSEESIKSFGTFFSILQEQETTHRVEGIEMEERIERDTLRRSNVADVVVFLLHDVEGDESNSLSDLGLYQNDSRHRHRDIDECDEEVGVSDSVAKTTQQVYTHNRCTSSKQQHLDLAQEEHSNRALIEMDSDQILRRLWKANTAVKRILGKLRDIVEAERVRRAVYILEEHREFEGMQPDKTIIKKKHDQQQQQQLIEVQTAPHIINNDHNNHNNNNNSARLFELLQTQEANARETTEARSLSFLHIFCEAKRVPLSVEVTPCSSSSLSTPITVATAAPLIIVETQETDHRLRIIDSDWTSFARQCEFYLRTLRRVVMRSDVFVQQEVNDRRALQHAELYDRSNLTMEMKRAMRQVEEKLKREALEKVGHVVLKKLLPEEIASRRLIEEMEEPREWVKQIINPFRNFAHRIALYEQYTTSREEIKNEENNVRLEMFGIDSEIYCSHYNGLARQHHQQSEAENRRRILNEEIARWRDIILKHSRNKSLLLSSSSASSPSPVLKSSASFMKLRPRSARVLNYHLGTIMTSTASTSYSSAQVLLQDEADNRISVEATWQSGAAAIFNVLKLRVQSVMDSPLISFSPPAMKRPLPALAGRPQASSFRVERMTSTSAVLPPLHNPLPPSFMSLSTSSPMSSSLSSSSGGKKRD